MRKSLVVALLFVAIHAGAQVVHDNFKSGNKWTMAEGRGNWDKKAGFLRVTGNGDDQSYWRRSASDLKPNSTYRVSFTVCTEPGSSTSTVIAGLNVCNRDFAASTTPQSFSFTFTTPDNLADAFFRLGQWHLNGSVRFSNFSLVPVENSDRRIGNLLLGEGESIDKGTYRFDAPLAGDGSNSSRNLAGHTAPFNSNRWVFTGGNSVTYRHQLPGCSITEATVEVEMNYHTGGECVVEASGGGANWVELGRIDAVKTATFNLPASLLPSDDLQIRLRGANAVDAAGNSAPGAFQVDRYVFSAKLAGPSLSNAIIAGATRYLAIDTQSGKMTVRVDDLGDLGTGNRNVAKLTLMPLSPLLRTVVAQVAITDANGKTQAYSKLVKLQTNKPESATVPYGVSGTGKMDVVLAVLAQEGHETVYKASTDAFVPTYFARGYGSYVGKIPGGTLFWCNATYKINPNIAPNLDTGVRSPIRVSAAGRERVAFQLALVAGANPESLQVSVTDLKDKHGHTISSSHMAIRQVDYVNVRVPTDRIGVAAEWPDPLPLLETKWLPRPNRVNPLWFTITVPANMPGGNYEGNIILKGTKTQRVPMSVHVWNYSLPEHTALRSGFGLSPDSIRQYHNLKTPEATATVWESYMKNFKEHRINTYNPMILAPFTASVKGIHWSGGQRDTTNPGDGKCSLRIVDNRTDTVVNAEYADQIEIADGHSYRLEWMVRTEKPEQQYQVTLGCLDSSRRWIPYHNIDITKTGLGQWEKVIVPITDSIYKDARYLTIALRPALWTEKGEQTGTAWFDDVKLIDETDNRNLVDGGDMENANPPAIVFDWAQFDKSARHYLDEMGFNAFTVSVMGLGGGRYPNYDNGSLFGFPAGTDEYDALMTEYGRQVQDHLEKNGWLNKAYVYWYDEPETTDYPFVCTGMDKLKKYMPKVKRMLTEEFHPALYGKVNLWCPLTPNYSHAPAAARQKLGEEVWWYVCTGPKEPYCALFIDHPAIEMRMWLWQTWKYGVQGILVWESAWWNSPQFKNGTVQNVWEDPMSYTSEASGVWGNGDGRFFYPPNRHPNEDKTTEFITEPIPSIRWEMLGEGIQDWEYFHMLDGLVKKAEARGDKSAEVGRARALLTIPDAVCRDMTHFTTDPQLLYAIREKVGRAIELLSARLKAGK